VEEALLTKDLCILAEKQGCFAKRKWLNMTRKRRVRQSKSKEVLVTIDVSKDLLIEV